MGDFSTKYLKDLAKLNKAVGKTDDKKAVYRFCYVNKPERLCLNTVFPKTAGGAGKPYFVLYDGSDWKEVGEEYKTPEGDLLKLPPIELPFFRDIYKKTIFPSEVLDNCPETSAIDELITKVLQRWFVQPDDYFVMARNYIKFSWVYERFRKTPALYVYGDWGTGKTEWGKFISWLCMYGQALDDVTAAALVRILDSTNSTIMLDEADYIDGDESEKMRRILRNGYGRGGTYIITEQEGKIHMPKSYLVDQPKIIVKRKWGKDDALNTRMIPFQMTSKDKEIPNSMRRNDEFEWESTVKLEMTEIANMLLRWRWDNIFLMAEPQIIDDMKIRYNDTISPLLKLATPEDRQTMIKYMRKHEKDAAVDMSDDFSIKIIRITGKIHYEMKSKGMGGPLARIFLTDVASRCVEEVSGEMSEHDAKKFFSSRSIKNVLKNFGIDTELYGNKVFIRWESLDFHMPRIADRYSFKYGDPEQEQPDPLGLEEKPVDPKDLPF